MRIFVLCLTGLFTIPAIAGGAVAEPVLLVADKVVNRTSLVVISGNEGSTAQASTYSAGDNVTLKVWESGATTLDGSGNTNMRVVVTGGPLVYTLDQAYGDPIVAVSVRELLDIFLLAF